jgi:hypothetical protein
MEIYVYKKGMNLEEQVNGAYWERNMLALLLAKVSNQECMDFGCDLDCGWYVHGEWEGWSRVISIFNGKITFHVPDSFDMGDLPQIEANWNGHTTEEKWKDVMEYCGISLE